MTPCHEVSCCLFVHRQPLALCVRAESAFGTGKGFGSCWRGSLVRLDAGPLEGGGYFIRSAWNKSRPVCVFDAQDETAVVLSCKYVAEESSAEAAKMQRACW